MNNKLEELEIILKLKGKKFRGRIENWRCGTNPFVNKLEDSGMSIVGDFYIPNVLDEGILTTGPIVEIHEELIAETEFLYYILGKKASRKKAIKYIT